MSRISREQRRRHNHNSGQHRCKNCKSFVSVRPARGRLLRYRCAWCGPVFEYAGGVCRECAEGD